MRTADALTLSTFEASHLEALVPMWRASFEAGVGVADPHPLSEQRDYFVTHVLPHHDVRLAWRDGQLVGFVAASQHSIAQLYVRVGCQRQGIGASLLNWAKAQSGGTLWLYAFVRNRNACAFYEHNGFVAIAYGFEPTWQLDDVKYHWTAAAAATPDARARNA